MIMARLLGLDYGHKRIGVAISDPLYITAQALGYISNNGFQEVVKAIHSYCIDYEIARIVVGEPLNLEGNPTEQTRIVWHFAKQLQDSVTLPISLHDESLTSKEAEETMILAGVSRKKRKQHVDGLAAQLMLQSFMATFPAKQTLDPDWKEP